MLTGSVLLLLSFEKNPQKTGKPTYAVVRSALKIIKSAGFQCPWRMKMDAHWHSERFSVPMEGESGCPRALREVFSAHEG